METTIPVPAVEVHRATGLWAMALSRYQNLARRKTLCCALVFILTIGIRCAMLPWFPQPQPSVHDELSYLVAGDTYASGRLTNPPHPFWQHFETYHVLVQPTYVSKYPMLQGMVLAAGEKLAGNPWVGVVISAGLMVAAVCWMLQGWTTPGLALLGALLFMLRVGEFSYWMNSYWGGAVPAMGGALTAGALARMAKGARLTSMGAVWALGLAILLHSRPFDGVVLGCSTGVALIWWLRKSGTSYRAIALGVGGPTLIVMGIAMAALLYDNYRVTGHALLVPYQLYEEQYVTAPMFFVQPLRTGMVYRHEIMRVFFIVAQEWQWNAARADPAGLMFGKLSTINDFFFGLWPLLVPPLIWPYRLKTTEERVTLALLGAFLLSVSLLIGLNPHYAAVVAGLLYLRFVQTLGRLYHWRPAGKPVGFAVAVFFVTLIGYQFCLDAKIATFPPDPNEFPQARANMIHTLDQLPGQQVVMVRYAPGHNTLDEWVYNKADIDGSHIVWAREMGPAQDRPFLDYYQGRKIWLLEPDKLPLKLIPYPADSEK